MGSFERLPTVLTEQILQYLTVSAYGGAVSLSATCRELQQMVQNYSNFDEFADFDGDDEITIPIIRRLLAFPKQKVVWLTNLDLENRLSKSTRLDLKRLGIYDIGRLGDLQRFL